MLRCSQQLMTVFERLKIIQLQQAVIHADETPLKVINDDKTHAYMWFYCTGVDSLDKEPPPLWQAALPMRGVNLQRLKSPG